VSAGVPQPWVRIPPSPPGGFDIFRKGTLMEFLLRKMTKIPQPVDILLSGISIDINNNFNEMLFVLSLAEKFAAKLSWIYT
jgi:hypothetical protein